MIKYSLFNNKDWLETKCSVILDLAFKRENIPFQHTSLETAQLKVYSGQITLSELSMYFGNILWTIKPDDGRF